MNCGRTDQRVLFRDVAQRRTVRLTQPERKARHVRVAPEVTKVLRGHRRAVVLLVDQQMIIDRVGLRVVVGESIDDCAAAAGVEQSDEELSGPGVVAGG